MKLGLIADVQYCDCDNSWNYEKTQERFYRNSVNHLDNAFDHFRQNNCTKILQLGDLIDGRCRTMKNLDNALKIITPRFECNDLETFHVTGNHELYNFTRLQLNHSFMGQSLRTYQSPNIDINYYRVNLNSKICLIILDTYEISVHNRQQASEECKSLAEDILRKNNPNKDWNEPTGAKRAKYVAFNGGIGEKQLQWLNEQLEQCTALGNIVILAGHIPIINYGKNPLCLLWNDEEVLSIIRRFPCVKAYICGHQHHATLMRTKQFVQISMPGIIEAQPDEKPFGILQIFDDKLTINDMDHYWPNMEHKFK